MTKRPSIASPKSIRLKGTPVPGAEDRQRKIPGFDQEQFSRSHVLCIGAGGIISQIAPTLCRKGIGKITLLDNDIVEASNLNRQRFYAKDIGKNKAVALAENLQAECIAATEICAIPMRLEEAIASCVDLRCDVAVCGVDNNPARVAASRHLRALGAAAVFTAVSADADHGYVFVQEKDGPCIGCLFPDIADGERYPCPGTPAVTDILQLAGAVVVYALDTLLMARRRVWNYRRFCLSGNDAEAAALIPRRSLCNVFVKPV